MNKLRRSLKETYIIAFIGLVLGTSGGGDYILISRGDYAHIKKMEDSLKRFDARNSVIVVRDSFVQKNDLWPGGLMQTKIEFFHHIEVKLYNFERSFFYNKGVESGATFYTGKQGSNLRVTAHTLEKTLRPYCLPGWHVFVACINEPSHSIDRYGINSYEGFEFYATCDIEEYYHYPETKLW